MKIAPLRRPPLPIHKKSAKVISNRPELPLFLSKKTVL